MYMYKCTSILFIICHMYKKKRQPKINKKQLYWTTQFEKHSVEIIPNI